MELNLFATAEKKVRYLRMYYNYVLVRLKIRSILPAYFINRIEVRECGEEMISHNGFMMRKSVAERLETAKSRLPCGYTIKTLSAWRDESMQTETARNISFFKLRDLRHVSAAGRLCSKDMFCAKVSGHATGGALDVALFFLGVEADCGTKYLECNSKTPTSGVDSASPAGKNRKILYTAMISAGFVNYPAEWWHYSYGDRMAAAYSWKTFAVYGEITEGGKMSG